MENEDIKIERGVETLLAPQTIYADQVAQLMVGPFITKLTLGMDDGVPGKIPRPVVTVMMPTAAFLHLADTIRSAVSAEEVKKHLIEQTDRYAEQIRSIS